MNPEILSHLQKNIDKNKRIKSSFLIDSRGNIHTVIKKEIESHKVDFIDGIEQYHIATENIIENKEKYEKVVKFLSKNCKIAWMLWTDSIGFIDKSDAALFQLFWSSDFF